ncbi:hypothetical protein MRX96_031508, partial [Rhipicephalus microplus]
MWASTLRRVQRVAFSCQVSLYLPLDFRGRTCSASRLREKRNTASDDAAAARRRIKRIALRREGEWPS